MCVLDGRLCDLRKERPLRAGAGGGGDRGRLLRFMGLKAKEVYFTNMSGLPAIESSSNVHIINYAVNL